MRASTLAALSLAACLAACDGGGGDGADGDERTSGSITLDPPTLMAGQTTQATFRDGDGAIVAATDVTWSSSDPGIAEVLPTGFVATFGTGDVTLTAQAGETSAVTTLAVAAPPRSVRFPVVELSPTVLPGPPGGGASIIVDGTETTIAVAITLANREAELVALAPIGDSKRFVAHLSEAQSSVEPRGERCFTNECWVGTVTIVDADPAKTHNRDLFVPYLAPDAPNVTPAVLDHEVQSTSYVVNVRNDGLRQDQNTPEVARAFYRHFPDAYEFLTDVEIAGADFSINFESARNRVSGIGLDLYDFSDRYGASPSGALLGFINWGNAYVSTGHVVTTHEMGHAFMNFLRATDYSSNVPHWPISSTAFGVMGAGHPNVDLQLTALGNDEYRVDSRVPTGGCTDLELYLFGLAHPGEVGDQILFADQTQEIALGNVLHGPVSRFSVDDVIAAYGPRVPAWDGNAVTFHMATIVVSRGRMLTPRELTYYDLRAREGEAREGSGLDLPFYVTTGGRGVLVTRLR